MAYRDTDHFIAELEKNGELVRIKEFCDPELIITEITDRVSKQHGGGKALLFENTGTGYPVLINAMGSLRRIEMALGTDDLENIKHEIEDLFKMLAGPKNSIWEKLRMLPQLGKLSSWMPSVSSGRGRCQEVIDHTPDLGKLPILKCWPADGGRFITFPMVLTKDPLTGIRNVGMYRMQVFGKDMTGMHWHKHKVGARHYAEYKKLGKRMPVAVALGGDPAHTFSATAPLPDNVDEFMLSGFLRKKKVELVRCITNELEVPADADFVLEGYIDTDEELIWEGPFGDHTGFYSLPDFYPRFHVTCITSRKGAVYPATIVGVPPMEDAYIAKATERIFLAPIQLTMLPELADMDMPIAGVAHNLVVVNFEKTFPGQGMKVMNALWGAGQMMFNKMLVAVDKTVDVHDYAQVAQAIAKHTNPLTDVFFGRGPLDVLDHSASKLAFGGKMFIDATAKMAEEQAAAVTASPDRAKLESLLQNTPIIVAFNAELQDLGWPFAIISIDKESGSNVRSLCDQLQDSGIAQFCSAVLVMDSGVLLTDLHHTLWIAMNNMDPQRDHAYIRSGDACCLVLDGTAKRSDADMFERDWPNIVTADMPTIAAVDSLWNRLGLDTLEHSPSLKFVHLLRNNGAFAQKKQ